MMTARTTLRRGRVSSDRRRGSRSLPAVLALTAVVIFAAFATACGGADASRCDTSEGAILSALDGVIAADNAGDLEAAVAHYTEDVIWLPPNGEVVRGRDEIAERYRQTFDAFDVSVLADAEVIEVEGDRASIQGRTTGELVQRDGGPRIPIDDGFLMLLECGADATWRISHLAWSHRGGAGAGTGVDDADEFGTLDPGDGPVSAEPGRP